MAPLRHADCIERLSRRPSTRAARDLLDSLRRRELNEAAGKISAETGLAYRPLNDGDHIAGVYRQRITLSSGRFAMIDDGLGYQLVPWRPSPGAATGSPGFRRYDVRWTDRLELWLKARARALALVGQRFD